jgi:two-component system response regulator AtoC
VTNLELTILVVDDDESFRRFLESALAALGCRVLAAASAEEALTLLDGSIALLITEIRLPDDHGLNLLTECRRRDFQGPVIVMTAHGTVSSAVEAMRRGAFDYLAKPFDGDELEIVVRRALDHHTLTSENRFLREHENKDFTEMVGRSRPMLAMFDQIRAVARSRSPVLVLGETGSGKELVARAVHRASERAAGLFVPINCAAIPADLLETELFGHVRGAFTGALAGRIGKFEMASGGTLFLDEIGDMPQALQAKLLRVLEDGVVERIGSNHRIRVDVRIVSATHRNLADEVARGRFRQDLLFRLDVLQVRVPPLRERQGDISTLATHFLEQFAAGTGRPPLVLDAESVELLEAHPWPGNVRELRNVCERLSVHRVEPTARAETVAHLLDLPEAGIASGGSESATLSSAVARAEVEAIERALARCEGNKAKAARLLGISERNLWYKLKRYGIEAQPKA